VRLEPRRGVMRLVRDGDLRLRVHVTPFYAHGELRVKSLLQITKSCILLLLQASIAHCD